MDYGKLVEALENGDSKELEALYTEAFQILCRFLRTTMRAHHQDAQECAQHALVMTMERLRKGAIRNPEKIYSYLLQSAKNRYMRLCHERDRNNFQENIERYAPVEEQIDSLVMQEKKNALMGCIAELEESSREFILFWMEHPEARSGTIARHFNISVNNVWTKRHRLVKKLSECVRKKINK
ncbi:MAG: sigma-70 family RNA polymerase sigma factor [Balneolaceae bacterium]|nr:MAG: sigma-70 family RNA polymerase sigma factor [Balneolaceae bacterium]